MSIMSANLAMSRTKLARTVSRIFGSMLRNSVSSKNSTEDSLASSSLAFTAESDSCKCDHRITSRTALIPRTLQRLSYCIGFFAGIAKRDGDVVGSTSARPVPAVDRKHVAHEFDMHALLRLRPAYGVVDLFALHLRSALVVMQKNLPILRAGQNGT